MKNFALIIAALTFISSNVHASSCVIDLQVKKQGAKSFYLSNGSKLSKKAVEKFNGVCVFNTSLMSASQVKSMKIADLKKKLAKLQK